jgi:steroid 5-alpha reductase family enzyme
MLKDRFGSWEAFIDLSGIHLFPTLQVFIAMVPVGFAFVFPEANEANGSTVLFVLGMLLSLAAILIEHVADNQLAQFRADPGNKGLMLQSGLWGVVQHPNYVGEMLFWWGVWLASYGLTAALWTVAGPITMTVMFVGISIPMMNRRLERRRENEASENDPAAAH